MITENYIKMCEQAEEIQKAWEPKAGDYVQLKNNRQIYLISSVEKSKDKKKVVFYTNIINGNDSWCYIEFFKDNFVYLPTQEQLQEMIIPILRRKFKDFWDMERINIWMIQHFINFMHDIDYLDTLNELWLAFVMYEKYNKIWTGEKWEEEKPK